MKVVVNGEPMDLRDGARVEDAVAAVRPPGATRGVAVAVNGTVVPKSAWSNTELTHEDKVEVLTAVAGG